MDAAGKHALRELLLDKLAMQDAKFTGIDLEHRHVTPELFYSALDDLCAKNLPAHFPGFLRKHPEALQIPSKDAILQSLAGVELEIAVTPKGNADSPENGMFAKPYVLREPLEFLLQKLGRPESEGGRHYYFQSQNDNLGGLVDRGCPVPRQLPIKQNTRLFGQQIAANLWIGRAGTVSRLHSDNFDNVYCQVSGTKRIHLIPPAYSSELGERLLAPATYNDCMQLVPDDDPNLVLFPTFDPNVSAPVNFPLFTVDLRAGDVLFLPALWYHQVSIVGPDVNISLNYWHEPFDDEYRWAEWNFDRQLALALAE